MCFMWNNIEDLVIHWYEMETILFLGKPASVEARTKIMWNWREKICWLITSFHGHVIITSF
jgi:hypothetical protein